MLKTIDELERRPAPAPRYRRYHDYGWWCGLAAAILLILFASLERTRWRTLP